MPTGQIVDIGAGTRALFEGGRILAKSGVGAHALWGRVLSEYLDRNGADGPLGFATSRVRGDGNGGSLADFEHGTIVCPDGQRCRLARRTARRIGSAVVRGVRFRCVGRARERPAKPSAIVVAWSAVIVPGQVCS